MSLRTRLVLVFLFLAVVPLGALVLYSYSSSLAAVRRAAEVEADDQGEGLAAGHVSGVHSPRIAEICSIPL